MEIERMTHEAWERVRAIRLRSLADAPSAFAVTLAEDAARPAASWRERLAASDAATFVARADGADGADVGLVVGASFRGREPAAGLFAMWVAPEARGAGVGARLVDAVVAWARERGHPRLLLEVADDNAAAIRLYERKGFAPTGVRGTLPPPREHVTEHERALVL